MSNPPLSNCPLAALIIGAGFSGICAGVKLRQAGIKDFVIVEKTSGISGTWHDNSYPGAACDVPSHLYSFSFAPNPNWSRRFSPAGEIERYTEKVVDDFSLRKHIKNNTKIVSAKFDKATALWHATDQKGNVIKARFIIASVAILGTPQMPEIGGMDDFNGPAFHSARWNHVANWDGKRVAIIGSAASALQIIPHIAKTAAHVDLFQRTANYVIPRRDRAYTKLEKLIFRTLPVTMKLPRLSIYAYLDFLFHKNFKQGSFINKYLTKMSAAYRKKQIADADLRGALTPNYPMGCKRVLLSDDFYQTLQRENVSVITDKIESITTTGVQTSSGQRPADIIVYATGFSATRFLTGIEMEGVNGATLKAWRKNPKAFRGLVVENMPNAFYLLGPNTGLGHSSMILMIEAQVKYMVKAIKSVPETAYLNVKSKAMLTYNQDIQKHLAGSIWATGCTSWYKTPDGTIPTMWPHKTSTFAKMMRDFDMNEYDLVKIS